MGRIASARIHPAIGVARVGDSPDEFFVGPEVLCPTQEDSYKDAEGRLKRQAARFRIYGYDSDGDLVGEITSADAEIVWEVHVANSKAAWYDFVVAMDLAEAATLQVPRRNSWMGAGGRGDLVIDPGPKTLEARPGDIAPLDGGSFLGTPVSLGELRTDEAGRLLFLGGHGVSATPIPGNTLTTFSNNSGWHDDVSDGPVHATVTIGGETVPVDPAWVVVAPPNYGPGIVSPQTMYDVMVDAVTPMMVPRRKEPSFTADILPLLEQFADAQWVNAGFLAQFGWGAPNEFTRPEILRKLASTDVTYQELRRSIFYMFRQPGNAVPNDVQWPPIYGDAFGNYDDSAKAGFTVTPTLYGYLNSWMNGSFVADYDPDAPRPATLEDVDDSARPAMLDRAALHWCMGGPFHPGCEMTWPMRQIAMYRAPFRLKERPPGAPRPDYGDYLSADVALADDGPLSQSGPGDVTRWMAVPWQTDTASCRSGYPRPPFPTDPYLPTFWPSRVPNEVLTEDSYAIVADPDQPMEAREEAFNTRLSWLRGLDLNAPYIHQITKMISDFGKLGVVERREAPGDGAFPPVMYVETGMTVEMHPKVAAAAAEARGTERVSEEFRQARYGFPGRRI
ncbi:MAG TPA: LodA/GoxA family CTQ-dependent oxidase [Actinomycetota bacterium]|nr:LodA/GoxA family CTQ-dependent oxidase [Actinomycetota bacterium]